MRQAVHRPSLFTRRRPGPGVARPLPRGLTLVELLATVGIIAMVAALLVPTIGNAMRSARTAAIKAEIATLNTALLNYRSEYGEVPPCTDPSDYIGFNGSAVRHLQRLFPRCPTAALPAQCSGGFVVRNAEGQVQPLPMRPENAMFLWLGGFTPDPRSPLLPPSARVKLFDFDTSRVNSGRYHPSKKPKSPFIYIDSASYATLPYTDLDVTIPGAHFKTLRPNQVGARRFTYDGTPNNQEFFNADTFQILCAGLDEQFGTDDDLSNFWPGTRKEYLDSLQQ